MDDRAAGAISKVPAVTLSFWVTKTLATTLGETGRNPVSMSRLGETTPSAANSDVSGYLVSTAIFGPVVKFAFQKPARGSDADRY